MGWVPVRLLEDVDRGAWSTRKQMELPASLSCQMSITSAQDPSYFPGSFSINQQGWLQVPAQGLKGQSQKVSMTWDLGGIHGLGMQWVETLPPGDFFVLGILDYAAASRPSPYPEPAAACWLSPSWPGSVLVSGIQREEGSLALKAHSCCNRKEIVEGNHLKGKFWVKWPV